ncbi:MAG: NAD-dependent epimerase/dehydratase family protein [Planctomycetaceae bacterium]|nr:NAD-dependent epimerase/dehydratase family protein [Planctomycetaceae bacterium]
MRILVVGCGYVGERAALAWARQGHEIVAVTRSQSRADQWQLRGWESIVTDIAQSGALRSLPEVDLCLYAVGYDRASGLPRRQVTVDGLGRVLSALRGLVGRLIYISSSSVYGQDAGEWVNEDSKCEPRTESGQLCLAAEQLVQAAARDMSATILRLSGIYGPNRLLARVAQLRNGDPLGGRGDAWLNLIHVDDVVNALQRLAEPQTVERESGACQLLLLSDEQPVLRSTFYTELARLVQAPAPSFDSSLPVRSGAINVGKRCDSQRIREVLGLVLRFPTVAVGLPQAVAATPDLT